MKTIYFLDLTIPSYKQTVENYILGGCVLGYGLLQALMLYVNIIASQALLEENQKLIKVIENKQINEDWMLGDAKLNMKVKQLEKYDGFDGKNFFTWNKSFITTIISTFLTYFIILIQFKDAEPEPKTT